MLLTWLPNLLVLIPSWLRYASVEDGYSYRVLLYTVLVSRCSAGISVELMLYFTGQRSGLHRSPILLCRVYAVLLRVDDRTCIAVRSCTQEFTFHLKLYGCKGRSPWPPKDKSNGFICLHESYCSPRPVSFTYWICWNKDYFPAVTPIDFSVIFEHICIRSSIGIKGIHTLAVSCDRTAETKRGKKKWHSKIQLATCSFQWWKPVGNDVSVCQKTRKIKNRIKNQSATKTALTWLN